MKVLFRKGTTAWRSLNPMQRDCAKLWVFLTVILGFVPIPIAWVANEFNKSGDAHPIRHGDLVLLASVLCFAGLAAMFRPRSDNKPRQLTGLVAGTLVLGIINIVLYTLFSVATQRHDMLVDWLSGISYGVSALCSLACTMVAEGGMT